MTHGRDSSLIELPRGDERRRIAGVVIPRGDGRPVRRHGDNRPGSAAGNNLLHTLHNVLEPGGDHQTPDGGESAIVAANAQRGDRRVGG